MSFFARTAAARAVCAGLAAILFGLLTACSGSARAVAAPPVGTPSGVTVLTNPIGASTQLQPGGTVAFTATVSADTSNKGVTWTLTGVGALSNITTTGATYTAPASGVIGATTPVITATSIHDTTANSTVTLVVLGTPVIVPPILFPGAVNSQYQQGLVVSGGKAPFVWAQGTGTLPPGITLDATSTTALTSFTGTPTTAGTYTFQVKVTDSNAPAITATVTVTIIVKAAEACLLEGQYAFVYTGFDSNKMSVGAGALTISTTGTISGYHNFSSTTTSPTVAETLTGTCTTRFSNNGELTLTGSKYSPEFNYAVTTALTRGRIQLDNGGDSKSASGFLQKQDPAAFDQTVLAGNYAFGTLGSEDSGRRLGLVGALQIDAGGTVTGHVDGNGSKGLTEAPVAGVLGTPDTHGHGTLTLTATASGGNQAFHFSYYVVNANRLLLVTTDGSPRMSGYMTRQTGTFDNSALANPAILSLFGAAQVSAPMSSLALARLSAANTATGTMVVHIDVADQLTPTFDETTGAVNGTYAVDATEGRTTFGFGTGAKARHFVAYLDSAANGYIVEQGSTEGNAGIVEPQSAGPFTSTVPGFFVNGTQFPEDVAPMVLLPAVSLANGTFSAQFASGFYSIDATTGRGVGSINVQGVGQSLCILYVVNPNRVVRISTGALNRSAVMDWLDAN
ncbi:MAG: putative Ig domain-containing protein [Steroidobacteraceae bacterium]